MPLNWEAIAAVGEILGAIAVLITLWYLSVQIRQSNKLAEAATYQSLGETTAAQWFEVARDPEFNVVFWQSLFAEPDWWEAQETATIQRLVSLYVGHVRLLETLFLQVELKLLDASALDSLGYSKLGSYPAVRYLLNRTGFIGGCLV